MALQVKNMDRKADPPVPATTAPPAPLRGVWIASVFNLDWPSAASAGLVDAGQRIEQQTRALQQIVADAVAVGLNTLVLQVKPCADALYRSTLLPWSPVLTGRHGADPGYDPLRTLLDLAHAAGLHVHAWLNPYRVSTAVTGAVREQLSQVPPGSPPSVFVSHPQWIRRAGGRYVLDPGEPGVSGWIAAIAAELAAGYDLDGLQFDDYFYTDTMEDPLDDAATYARHGSGFADKADWRRANTRRLVESVHRAVKAMRPQMAFGVSPAGVWRNLRDDPRGSDTRAGAPNYDVAHADTRQWVQQGLVDYIVPQIYWPFALPAARYDVVLRWWADTVRGTGVALYAGMALHKVGMALPAEPDWAVEEGVPEFARQLELNEALPEVAGCLLFRQRMLGDGGRAAVRALLVQRWKTQG